MRAEQGRRHRLGQGHRRCGLKRASCDGYTLPGTPCQPIEDNPAPRPAVRGQRSADGVFRHSAGLCPGLRLHALVVSDRFLDRERSWLRFNERVLFLAQRPDVPALERMKFVTIASSNLDEFFRVRVGSQLRITAQRQPNLPFPKLVLDEPFQALLAHANDVSRNIARTLETSVLPPLAQEGIRILRTQDIEGEARDRARELFVREVHPCLTPIAVESNIPFPTLRSGVLAIAFRLERTRDVAPSIGGETTLAIVEVPEILPRFLRLSGPDSGEHFVVLEDLVAMFSDLLLPGYRVLESTVFRIVRASDLDIVEDEVEDLLTSIRDELRQRDRAEPTRLEIAAGASETLSACLEELIGVHHQLVAAHPGLLAPLALRQVYAAIDRRELKDPPVTPIPPRALRYVPSMFRAIREKDILLFHPYESFQPVVDFIEEAASDPDVVAIKQTLYRTSGDSPIVKALARAAEAGKQVTAVIEIKARFDEAANIAWAKSLEESGVHVVYGLIGLKTHAKMLLIVRQEFGSLSAYLHLSTGNYNPTTARFYTDLGLLTANPELTNDAMYLFNVLTGYAELPDMSQLVVSPFNLREKIHQWIDREINHAAAGRPAGIRVKMNALVDEEVIEHLYEASQAGVPIQLFIRGICCLRPGVPGLSENVEVRSIVDRFLEHARILWWANGGTSEVYLSSADWMPRNLDRRIETTFPVLDVSLRERIEREILDVEARDDTFAWRLLSDGSYEAPIPAEERPFRAQERILTALREQSAATGTSVRNESDPSHTDRVSPAVRAAQAQDKRRLIATRLRRLPKTWTP
jgi:polyphosphate kinase